MRSPDEPVGVLTPVIASLTGRPPANSELTQFRQYLALLLTWNRTHRLTGCRSAEAIVRQLFLDSLLFLARLPKGRLRMVDIGTGPGIPGIPLRIIRPEISLTVIDSRRKQVSFLAALKRELDLTDVAVLEGRAEDLVSEQPALADAFDVVVSRAVGTRLLSTALLYLKSGGRFIAGGPPAPIGDLAKPDGLAGVQLDTVRFAALRLSRTFLLATKAP